MTPTLSQGAEIAERDDLEDAVRWIGVVREELAAAGFPPGDRTVALASIRSLLAAREALAARIVPEGWKLVPVEPTGHMLSEGYRAMPDAINAGLSAAYAAMLAASPVPNVPPQENEGVAIKPLEWHEESNGDFVAKTIAEDYWVQAGIWTSGWYWTRDEMESSAYPFFEEADQAKAAAQADYEQRIRSALVSPPPSPATAGAGEQLAEAKTYATNLLVHFVNEHCDPVPEWKPLPDLIGVLTQLDNAMTVTRKIKAAASDKSRVERLETAVDALRDLEIKFSPPEGMSIRQATIAEAQRLVRQALGDRS